MTQSNEPPREVAYFYNDHGKPHYRSSLSPVRVKSQPDFMRKVVGSDLPVGSLMIFTCYPCNQ